MKRNIESLTHFEGRVDFLIIGFGFGMQGVFLGGTVVKEHVCKRHGFDLPGWKDPLKAKMATYSSILVWKIPWIEEPGRLQSPWDHKTLIRTEHIHKKIKLLVIPL